MRKPLAYQDVLEFWFSLNDPDETDDAQVEWHLGDARCRALQGKLNFWSYLPESRLALILLFDQVPRHLFRHDARAFATDHLACELTRLFLQTEDWRKLTAAQWAYGIRPFLHAEDLPLQLIAQPVLQALSMQVASLSFMGKVSELYIETIDRFGHFPHRNTLRGLRCSDEEQDFLDHVWYPRRRSLVPPSKSIVEQKRH